MMNPNLTNHRLTFYVEQVRWQGDLAIASHRRLSDYFGDRELRFVVLNRVAYERWEFDNYAAVQDIESILLVKENITIITSTAPPPPADERNTERVKKLALRMLVHAPPLLLLGNFFTPPAVSWLDALSVSRTDYVPLTNVRTWHYQTRVPLEENLPLALVQVRRVVGMHLLKPDAPAQ